MSRWCFFGYFFFGLGTWISAQIKNPKLVNLKNRKEELARLAVFLTLWPLYYYLVGKEIYVEWKKEKKKRYRIEVTENQAQLISSALEFYSRMGMGQFGELLWHHFPRHKLSDAAAETADKLLDQLHVVLCKLPANAYNGIRSDKIGDHCRMAYDLHQVIRHRLAHDRFKPGDSKWNTHLDEPDRLSKEPLATIESFIPMGV